MKVLAGEHREGEHHFRVILIRMVAHDHDMLAIERAIAPLTVADDLHLDLSAQKLKRQAELADAHHQFVELGRSKIIHVCHPDSSTVRG